MRFLPFSRPRNRKACGSFLILSQVAYFPVTSFSPSLGLSPEIRLISALVFLFAPGKFILAPIFSPERVVGLRRSWSKRRQAVFSENAAPLLSLLTLVPRVMTIGGVAGSLHVSLRTRSSPFFPSPSPEIVGASVNILFLPLLIRPTRMTKFFYPLSLPFKHASTTLAFALPSSFSKLSPPKSPHPPPGYVCSFHFTSSHSCFVPRHIGNTPAPSPLSNQ